MNQGKKTFPPLMPSASIGHGRWFDSDPQSRISALEFGHHSIDADERSRPAKERSPHDDGPRIGLAVDLLIRAVGLAGIGLAVLACYALYHLLHHGKPAEPTLGQYGLAMLTFLGASIGSSLVVLGRHVHDRIEVAERWRRRW